MMHFEKFRYIRYAVMTSAFLTVFAQAEPTPTTNEMDFFMTQKISSNNALIDTLEIVGVGVSVETWRNHPDYPKNNLWDSVKDGNGGYIISQDPKQYPKALEASQMMSGKRNDDASNIALRDFMDRYPLPIAVVGPSWHSSQDDTTGIEEIRESNADSFVRTSHTEHYTARGRFDGLLTQSGQVMASYLNDNPDKLWDKLFSTFDEHADIPAIGVAAKDGIIQRSADFYKSDVPKFEKLSEQAYSPKNSRILSDNWTFLTMVRRGRIDWLRPYSELAQDKMKVKEL